jgi:hypothetical protein
MKVKGRITSSEFKKEWKGPKGVLYFHDIKVDGFEHTINVGSKTQSPPHLAVGQQIELEANEGEFSWKGKVIRENNFSGGGKKGGFSASKIRTYADIIRGCKASALKAAATINKAHGREEIKEEGCNVIARYVLGDIRGDIQNKWESPELDDMMSRQTALHAAADEYEVHKISTAERLVEIAQVKYKYITS